MGTMVAPYMGAWIETLPAVRRITRPKSLPIWERGLKLNTLPEV